MSEPSKIALVTGASRGLGFATAAELGARGYHVIALARTVGGLEDLADKIEAAGGTCTLVPLDITDEGGLQRMAMSIFERWGKLDLVVHCAAHGVPLSPVHHIAEKDFDKAMAVNARATQRLIAMVDPLLRPVNGTAIFMDDRREGQKFFGTYAAVKAAARAIVDSWRAENENLGLDIRWFTPNPMPTGLRARFFPGEDREALTPTEVEAQRLLDSL